MKYFAAEKKNNIVQNIRPSAASLPTQLIFLFLFRKEADEWWKVA